MADAISPCRHQCFWQWHDWPSSALAAHGRQHYCASGPVRPLPDNYALVTDERTDNQNDVVIE